MLLLYKSKLKMNLKHKISVLIRNKEDSLRAVGGCLLISIIGYLLIKYWSIPTLVSMSDAMETHTYYAKNYLSILAIATIYFTILSLIFFLISIYRKLDGGLLCSPVICSVLGMVFGFLVAGMLAFSINEESSVQNMSDPVLILGSIFGLTIGFILGIGLGIKQDFD